MAQCHAACGHVLLCGISASSRRYPLVLRQDPRYTHDSSAFDVLVHFNTPSGGRDFVGIEVKYHENLSNRADRHRPRYDEVAEAMACFVPEACGQLRCKPLQQIWRDHLLAGAYRLVDCFDDGLFAYLYPADNTACATALKAYNGCLTSADTFAAWTLEAFADTIAAHTDSAWIGEFTDRYLEFEKVDSMLA